MYICHSVKFYFFVCLIYSSLVPLYSLAPQHYPISLKGENKAFYFKEKVAGVRERFDEMTNIFECDFKNYKKDIFYFIDYEKKIFEQCKQKICLEKEFDGEKKFLAFQEEIKEKICTLENKYEKKRNEMDQRVQSFYEKLEGCVSIQQDILSIRDLFIKIQWNLNDFSENVLNRQMEICTDIRSNFFLITKLTKWIYCKQYFAFSLEKVQSFCRGNINEKHKDNMIDILNNIEFFEKDLYEINLSMNFYAEETKPLFSLIDDLIKEVQAIKKQLIEKIFLLLSQSSLVPPEDFQVIAMFDFKTARDSFLKKLLYAYHCDQIFMNLRFKKLEDKKEELFKMLDKNFDFDEDLFELKCVIAKHFFDLDRKKIAVEFKITEHVICRKYEDSKYKIYEKKIKNFSGAKSSLFKSVLKYKKDIYSSFIKEEGAFLKEMDFKKEEECFEKEKMKLLQKWKMGQRQKIQNSLKFLEGKKDLISFEKNILSLEKRIIFLNTIAPSEPVKRGEKFQKQDLCQKKIESLKQVFLEQSEQSYFSDKNFENDAVFERKKEIYKEFQQHFDIFIKDRTRCILNFIDMNLNYLNIFKENKKDLFQLFSNIFEENCKFILLKNKDIVSKWEVFKKEYNHALSEFESQVNEKIISYKAIFLKKVIKAYQNFKIFSDKKEEKSIDLMAIEESYQYFLCALDQLEKEMNPVLYEKGVVKSMDILEAHRKKLSLDLDQLKMQAIKDFILLAENFKIIFLGLKSMIKNKFNEYCFLFKRLKIMAERTEIEELLKKGICNDDKFLIAINRNDKEMNALYKKMSFCTEQSIFQIEELFLQRALCGSGGFNLFEKKINFEKNRLRLEQFFEAILHEISFLVCESDRCFGALNEDMEDMRVLLEVMPHSDIDEDCLMSVTLIKKNIDWGQRQKIFAHRTFKNIKEKKKKSSFVDFLPGEKDLFCSEFKEGLNLAQNFLKIIDSIKVSNYFIIARLRLKKIQNLFDLMTMYKNNERRPSLEDIKKAKNLLYCISFLDRYLSKPYSLSSIFSVEISKIEDKESLSGDLLFIKDFQGLINKMCKIGDEVRVKECIAFINDNIAWAEQGCTIDFQDGLKNIAIFQEQLDCLFKELKDMQMHLNKKLIEFRPSIDIEKSL